MIYLEIPTWLAIVGIVVICILLAHYMLCDFLATLAYKCMKNEENKDKNNDK